MMIIFCFNPYEHDSFSFTSKYGGHGSISVRALVQMGVPPIILIGFKRTMGVNRYEKASSACS